MAKNTSLSLDNTCDVHSAEHEHGRTESEFFSESESEPPSPQKALAFSAVTPSFVMQSFTAPSGSPIFNILSYFSIPSSIPVDFISDQVCSDLGKLVVVLRLGLDGGLVKVWVGVTMTVRVRG
jgi:hypothetical protein